MVNTVSTPGPFDPLGKADPDQPFFPLMAGDPLAPPLVYDWVERKRREARGIEDEAERRRVLHKCLEAEEIAWAMERWVRTGEAQEKRAPEVRARYGDTPQVDEYAWKSHVASGASALRDAAYHLSAALSHLPPAQAEHLAAEIVRINTIAASYEPRRASFGEVTELPAAPAEADA